MRKYTHVQTATCYPNTFHCAASPSWRRGVDSHRDVKWRRCRSGTAGVCAYTHAESDRRFDQQRFNDVFVDVVVVVYASDRDMTRVIRTQRVISVVDNVTRNRPCRRHLGNGWLLCSWPRKPLRRLSPASQPPTTTSESSTRW